MKSIIGQGVFTVAELSDLTRIPAHRIRYWLHPSRAFLHCEHERIQRRSSLSFLNLVEVLVAGQLTDKGISLQTVRRVYICLQKKFNHQHPFADARLKICGGRILCEEQACGAEHLVDILTCQSEMCVVLKPILENLEYDPTTELATQWTIANGIVVDPQINFGTPVMKSTGIPAHVLATAFYANDKNASLVADWYDTTTKDVLFAVNFNSDLAA